MTVRKILFYPNPKLRLPAKPIEHFNAELKTLAEDMFDTMYEFHGVGLAATQIGVLQRVIVIDTSDNKTQQKVLVNPEIIETDGSFSWDEGCLSVPGIFEKVTQRANYVKVKAQDLNGKVFEIESTGDLLAVCIQHEIDHLNGKLFIDYLSLLKQQRIRQKLEKQKDLVLCD